MHMKITISLILVLILVPLALHADEMKSRYFHSGDGSIHLFGAKNGSSFSGIYRKADGTYDEAAMRRIHRVFSAKYGEPISTISPRLIEFLDFLEQNLNPGAKITIVSGYRSPTYNTSLRKNGRLAAKASMHQYGMATDIRISGVHPEKLWIFVRGLEFGGAGYYHGTSVHVDVGPARFWDEKTSGVGSGAANYNKLTEIVTDKDIYKPGEPIEMRFIRMTLFPIGVNPKFLLERKDRSGKWKRAKKFIPSFAVGNPDKCPQFENIEQMLGIKWQLPEKMRTGRYRIRASFCGEMPEGMPQTVTTPEFEVTK